MLRLKTVVMWVVVVAALSKVGVLLFAHSGGSEKKVFEARLPNVPGMTLTAVVVEYPPGGKSPAHHHAGSVFAYVLTGEIRSRNSTTGPVRIYRAGETFFEPPGSDHTISDNASTTKPASLLAVFVAEDGSVLTKPGPSK
jgi:quercetin dioxygenase-like cupin family protein